MFSVWFFGTAFLSVGAGLYLIGVTFQLQEKYQLNYLSTYLYYQIFLFVFGVYGILGREIAGRILLQQGTPYNTVETFGYFFSFLGIPFLLFAWYMFIRLCHEINDKKISRDFSLIIFFVLGCIFTAYGALIGLLNLLDFGDESFQLLSTISRFLYVISEAVILGIALLNLFMSARILLDGKKRGALQTFVYLNWLGLGAGIAGFFFLGQHRTLGILYLFVFFARNVPPLLYWRAYLRKNYVAPVMPATDQLSWIQFIEKYKISKREEEVIRLICDGKTNKEISEILYISLQTVKDHVYRIFQKTDVKNRVLLINLIQGTREK